MATINWKILALLTALLLAALGLQAGSIKIMLNMAHPQASIPATPPLATARRPVAPVEEHPTADLAPTVKEPKPTTLVTDPPHLATPVVKSPSASDSEPNPETHAIASTPPAVTPSAEAALLTPAKPAPTHPQDSHTATSAATPGRTAAATGPTPPTAAASPEAGLAAPVPAAVEPTRASALQEPEWLKNRDPKHYTVQLYSGKDMATLKEIAASISAGEPQAYYSTGSRSGAWHSLVAGDYPDSATAQAAAAKFTTQSPALKPWIRRFEEIQGKLR